MFVLYCILVFYSYEKNFLYWLPLIVRESVSVNNICLLKQINKKKNPRVR